MIQPFYQFCNFRQINILDIIKSRYFFQPPVGKNITAAPHVDIYLPHWVFLYYVNDSEGDTVFYNDSGDEIKRVSPKKGRVAFFNGEIYHSATKPKSQSRAVININFKGKLYN